MRPQKSPRSNSEGSSSSSTVQSPPARLHFVPGGVLDPPTTGVASLTTHRDEHLHRLGTLSDPAALLARALEADDAWNRDAGTYYDGYRAPSLSFLAAAALSPVTGAPPRSVRRWVDAAVRASLTTDGQKRPPVEAAAALAERRSQSESSSSAGNRRRPRRPCGYIFRRGDIAWNCRTCQTDHTCVLCDACFRASDHVGHDVLFHRTSPGGCCDCGDAEAWKVEGCCPAHRPEVEDQRSTKTCTVVPNSGTLNDDDSEAVRASARGRADADAAVRNDDSLTSRQKAVLGVVIGAVVGCVTEAVDGSGVAADASQWPTRWEEQLRAFAGNEDDASTEGPFPEGFRLILRLHNDDVHTFEEVIDALHDPGDVDGEWDEEEPSKIDAPTTTIPTQETLVRDKHDAETMTHHVDADGQVQVKLCRSFVEAKRGFARLRSVGLFCAVATSLQEDAERRARALAGWLREVAAAHPVASALVVAALLDATDGREETGGVAVWREPRGVPSWCGSDARDPREVRRRAFPATRSSSYLTEEESRALWAAVRRRFRGDVSRTTIVQERLGVDGKHVVPADPFPDRRLRKSPHALWGTLPVPRGGDDGRPPHPLLADPSRGPRGGSDDEFVALRPDVLVLDTDVRKQSEAERLTTSLFPHTLSGLYCVSGVGLARTPERLRPSSRRVEALLRAASYRAPLSPLLLLLLLDPYPPKNVRAVLHQLFLSSLVDPRFRSRFAAALGGVAYRPLSTLFCAGCGTEADTPLGFSVQVLTTGSLVRALGSPAATKALLEHDGDDDDVPKVEARASPIASTIVRAVHVNLMGATKEVKMVVAHTSRDDDAGARDDPSLVYVGDERPSDTPLPAAPDDGFLEARTTKHKRLPHLLRDLEYVLETPGTAARLLAERADDADAVVPFAAAWARLLRLAQGMDPQKRKTSGGHVEYEQQRWYEAFGLSLNLCSGRDALSECAGDVDPRPAAGELCGALLREIKSWLYREGLLDTGLPGAVSPHGGSPNHTFSALHQSEVLQSSTLHVASPDRPDLAPVAVNCVTGIKMTEAQLTLIETELGRRENDVGGGSSTNTTTCESAIMGDWLRVPHSPLMGHLVSFHLPLHRALARTVRGVLSVVVPRERREADPRGWWRIPLLDDPAYPLPEIFVPAVDPVRNCKVIWSDGPDASPDEIRRRRARTLRVAAAVAAGKVLHSLCDHPLRCLAASQQIERHLWVKNGGAAMGMALNYGSSPLCRSFRDLDLTLVQLSAAGGRVGLGPRRCFGLLLSRFNLDGYLCDPVRRAGGGDWVRPPRMQDPDHAVAVAEAFFGTLCVLVTETPPPPPLTENDGAAVRRAVRRELLHALAAEPRSFSEASAAASASLREGDGDTDAREVFAEVLRGIAEEKRADASRAAPPTFSLRPEVAEEYDPCFFHSRRGEHQHAMEAVARARRRAARGTDRRRGRTCALVAPPPPAHPRFAPCRLLLHTPQADAAARRALLFALTGGEWTPPEPPAAPTESGGGGSLDQNQLPTPPRTRRNFPRSAPLHARRRTPEAAPPRAFSPDVVASSSVSFLEVLQTLTLQVHTLEECASFRRTHVLDAESAALVADLSADSFVARWTRVPAALEDCWALRSPEPLPSAGSGARRGSVLGLLLAVYEHRSGGDADAAEEDGGGGARSLATDGLRWLLRFVHALVVDGAPSAAAARRRATEGRRDALDEEEEEEEGSRRDLSLAVQPALRELVAGMYRDVPNLWPEEVQDSASSSVTPTSAQAKNRAARKAAQARALEMMRRKQASFAASIASSMEDSAIDGARKDGDEEEENICIICKCDDADGSTNGPLGFLGHVQRSRVLQLRGTTELGSDVKVHNMARVVGDSGCQLRAKEEMNSAPIACIPRGSVVTVLQSKISNKYDLSSRRVLVRCDQPADSPNSTSSTTIEGWASVQSSAGYVILAPLRDLCVNHTRWGGTRPIVRQCGHAAHLGCVETHCVSLHARSAADQPFDGRFAANVSEGEFLCPLCKQLSNVLVPRGWSGGSEEGATTEPKTTTATTSAADSSLVHRSPIDRLRRRLVGGADRVAHEWRRLDRLDHDDDSPVARAFRNEKEATKRFGDNLLLAMQTPWHRRHEEEELLPALRKWDYEDDAPSDDDEDERKAGNRVGDVLRALRQVHVAWAAVGHGAASAEASARRGGEPPRDPWSGPDGTSRGDHPAWLEARRTLRATASLTAAAHHDVRRRLGRRRSGRSSDGAAIVARLLADVLDGRTFDDGDASDGGVSDQWRALLPYVASVPCHVARDGALSPRHEARAAAAALWAVRGASAASRDPPVPLAVDEVRRVGRADLDDGWGTNDPYEAVASRVPFRPAVASSFLYVPLLAWDMNTLAGAVCASLTSADDGEATTADRGADLLAAARALLVGRLVQILVTPHGHRPTTTTTADDDQDGNATMSDGTEARCLGRLRSRCQNIVDGRDPNQTTSENDDDDDENDRLMTHVSHALLPFSRSLLLLLRACRSALGRRERSGATSTRKSDPSERTLDTLLEDPEVLESEDGFHVLRVVGGVSPSDLFTSANFSWTALIDRWVRSLVALESYHGSDGAGPVFDAATRSWTPPYVAPNHQQRSGTAAKRLVGDDSVIVVKNETHGHHEVEVASGGARRSGAAVVGPGPVDVYRTDAATNDDHDDDHGEGSRLQEGGGGGGGVTEMDTDSDYPDVHDDVDAMETDDESDEEMNFVDDGDFSLHGDDDEEEDDGDRPNEDGASPPSEQQPTDVGGARCDDERSMEFADGNDESASSKKFSRVSGSSIIPYQPSLLGRMRIGPGPNGVGFDYVAASKVMCDLSHLGMVHSPGTSRSGLIRMPDSFVELYNIVNKVKRRDLTSADDAEDNSSSEMAICLLTGAIMRSGSQRRDPSRSSRPPGPCTLHARQIGSGVGIFFLVQKCTVLLMHNNKSAYSASLYVDDHGEEDPGLRRGRPLFLKKVRYQALETLWRQHGIPREVSQIRSTSDRVIRDNWY